MIGSKKLKLILVPTIITLVVFVILFRLGWWQLERAEEKRLELAQYDEQGSGRAVELEYYLKTQKPIQHAHVEITGKVLSQQTFYWDNRIKDGVVGYEVVTPVMTNVGVVMVNFGWVPATDRRSVLPMVNLPSDVSSLPVVMVIPKNNVFIKETLGDGDTWPKLVQQLDLSVFEKHSDVSLLPYVGFVNHDFNGQLRNNFEPVVMPPEKHIAYAVQWFGLAIAVLIVFYFAVKKINRNDSE